MSSTAGQDDLLDTAPSASRLAAAPNCSEPARPRRASFSAERAALPPSLPALRREVQNWFTPEALETVWPSDGTEAERIAREYLCAAGKRWRPFLTVATFQALAGRAAESFSLDMQRLAVSVECLHKASLIHDDIEDGDGVRGGRPALHAVHGLAVALNAGDLLVAESYHLIAETGFAATRKARLLALAAEGHRGLCLGQGAELGWARNPRPLEVDEVLAILRQKTAPLFGSALRLGAAAAGAEDEVGATLSEYSQALGCAYQIRDDLADFFAGEGRGDLAGGRPSVLLALACARAAGEQRALLERLWRGGADLAAEQPRIREALAATDAEADARALLRDYQQAALRSLSHLRNGRLKSLLRCVLGRICDPPAPCRER